ncbi:hypothetical protein GY45DRAFT_501985 [Cubamyces sp. BRFM 1775]|nr:hypothetical protein GY45DRAFT_501985 [Cubamyces sp. BRFM 1775]
MPRARPGAPAPAPRAHAGTPHASQSRAAILQPQPRVSASLRAHQSQYPSLPASQSPSLRPTRSPPALPSSSRILPPLARGPSASLRPTQTRLTIGQPGAERIAAKGRSDEGAKTVGLEGWKAGVVRGASARLESQSPNGDIGQTVLPGLFKELSTECREPRWPCGPIWDLGPRASRKCPRAWIGRVGATAIAMRRWRAAIAAASPN